MGQNSLRQGVHFLPVFSVTAGQHMESVPLRPGLMVQIAHVPSTTAYVADFAIAHSPVIFGFILSGSNHCHYDQGQLRNTRNQYSSGNNRITYLPDTAGRMESLGGMDRVSIFASQEFLGPYLDAASSRLPRQFAQALSGHTHAFQWSGQHSIHKMRLAADIFTSACSDPLRALHLETRALELISIQLSEYLPEAAPLQKLNTTDIRKIREAREILLQDLESPPSLTALARMAGLNVKKLTSGFKQIFGSPVFDYFRSYRLEMAKELLATGHMNVTEVGMYIGYQNLGHFSGEFRKKYGITPKKFQERERRQ